MKITPKIPQDEMTVEVNSLKKGDTFLAIGALFMLIEADPEGINLTTGERYQFDNDDLVVPTICTISWVKKHKKKKSSYKK